MMQQYVHENAAGCAVVNADSPEEALEILKAHERDAYLSHNLKPEDMKLAFVKKGMVIYYAT